MTLWPAPPSHWRFSRRPLRSESSTLAFISSSPGLLFIVTNYDEFLPGPDERGAFRRGQITDGTFYFCDASGAASPRGRFQSGFARTTRAAGLRRRVEWVSFARRRRSFCPGARRLGTDGMGPRPPSFPASHDVATARDSFLGHGRVAHGLECERRRAE